MSELTTIENLILLLGFVCGFLVALVIVTYIIEEILARHRRKIQNFKRWFR